MQRKIILPTILLTGALAVGSIGITHVYAQEGSSYPPIVEKLAEKFGLNKDEVLGVFEEHRSERHAEMEANFAERLNDMVVDGKITAEQKQKILDKHEEMQAKMDERKSLNPEERKAKMLELRGELKKWAEDNDIKFPFFGLRLGFGKGFKMGYHMGKMN